jgi:hypothetical protein
MVAIAAVVALPALAEAQDRRVVNPPTRKAIIAPAPEQSPAPGQTGVDPNRPRLWSVPILTLPDGRVFADFGYGFEQVVTSCAASVTVQPSAVPAPTAAQPVVTQPAPAQATGSEQMLNTRPVNGMSVTVTTAASSCWSSESGSVQVFRR